MKYGLIGEKLGHSFSKPIHEKIAGYCYEIKEIKKEALDGFMKQKDFLGINVTIPYKSEVIAYLDEIDENAKKTGAVNTVVNRDGKLYGFNTDFGGLKMLIERQGFDFSDKKVLVLGSGGTSKTAVAVSQKLGAASIITVSRKGEVNYENVYNLHPDASFIINTTPCGMYPDNQSLPIDPVRFKGLQGVTDVVYNPLKTRLCIECEKAGIAFSGGLYMLVCQAVLACEKFMGKSLDVKKLAEEIYGEILSEKRNIVLIGMPGSGKSTIGKALSQKTGKEFLDTDEMIVSSYGNISDIFSQKGEEYFRDIESEAVLEASKLSGKIIATGGGAILRNKNVEHLRQNGCIVFLDRPLCDIIPTDDRPLSKDIRALEKRFEERYDKYLSAADVKIDIDGIVENSVNKIMENIK